MHKLIKSAFRVTNSCYLVHCRRSRLTTGTGRDRAMPCTVNPVLLWEPLLNADSRHLRILSRFPHPAQPVGDPVDMGVYCHSTGAVPGNVHHQVRHLGSHSRQGTLQTHHGPLKSVSRDTHYSLVPRPTLKQVAFEQCFGCADAAVSVLRYIIRLLYIYTCHQCECCAIVSKISRELSVTIKQTFPIDNDESAIPIHCSIVTRPFSSPESGCGLGTRLQVHWRTYQLVHGSRNISPVLIQQYLRHSLDITSLLLRSICRTMSSNKTSTN